MKKEKWFWGIFFILAAVLMIISKLGVMGLDISIGMLFLSVLFVAALIKSILHVNIPGILFSLAFLYIIFGKVLGIEGALTPWTVLVAALLGSIGISIIYHPKHRWHTSHYDDSFSSVETIKGDRMIVETSFGSSVKYIDSEDFKGMNVRCSFGGVKVYFDKAIVPDKMAQVCLDVSFGGVEFYVPRTWKVVNQVSASFAEVEEKGRCETNGEVTLVLDGKVSFGGITIIYI